jgi:hypothetical protein
VGILVADALQTGTAYAFPEENALDTWQRFLWGEHYGLRVMSSLLATAAGSWIAGLVARRKGFTIGCVSALPTACVWAFLAYARWKGTLIIGDAEYDSAASVGQMWGAILLAVVSLPVAGIVGGMGSNLGRSAAGTFDGHRHAFLGISWYHCLWSFFFLNIVVIQTGWSVAYASRWFVPQVLVGGIVPRILASFFFVAMFATLTLTAKGLARAYRTLAGFEAAESSVARTVLGYGVGLPVLAFLLQEVLGASHFGLAHLLRAATE